MFLNFFISNVINKLIESLYINILNIIFKYINLYIYHWPRSEIKIL